MRTCSGVPHVHYKVPGGRQSESSPSKDPAVIYFTVAGVFHPDSGQARNHLWTGGKSDRWRKSVPAASRAYYSSVSVIDDIFEWVGEP